MRKEKLPAGLYLVSTPIGSARDITLRALDILASADVLAAEDTRNARKLMDIHGVALGGRPLMSYHDHNGERQRPKILGAIEQGQSVAFVSDAGTPLVADPGFGLAKAVGEQGLPITTAPGASAVLAALCLSGLPSDRFTFLGFLPNKTKARRAQLAVFGELPTTLIFYESPNRVLATVEDMIVELGEDRPAALCRELTKKFEEVLRGNLSELAGLLRERTSIKGECVLVLGPPAAKVATEAEIETRVREELTKNKVNEAAGVVAGEFGLSKRNVYSLALKLKDQMDDR